MPNTKKQKVENIKINLHELMGRKDMRHITELSAATSISPTVLYDLSNGNKRSVRLDTLVRICKVLECDIGELVVIKK